MLNRYLVVLVASVLFLASVAYSINYFIFQFPGNNYFPPHAVELLLFLILLNIGFKLCFHQKSIFNLIGNELIYFFGVMSIIVVATNSVQYTPFLPIDAYIIAFEKSVHINMLTVLAFINEQPLLKKLLQFFYNSLAYQMSIIPIIVIISGHFQKIRTYYALLLLTTLIGFVFYYFFPTIAPASSFSNVYLFDQEQRDTGIKFYEIHHYLVPSTLEGGLIAFPSFHVAWAVLCVNLVRHWPFFCKILSFFNVMLIFSCVALGWHYCTDIVGSVFLLIFCFIILYRLESLSHLKKIQ